ncbi:MAG: ComEC/Rec2 family competence protein, partial [Kiritimatiellia bacterium]
MKLPGLAACMLAAAALLPWLDFSSPLVMAGVAGLSALILFRQTRSPAVVFLLCLLWVFWRGSPGPTDLRRQLSPETRSVRLRFQVRGDQTRIEKEDGSAEIWVPVRVNEVYLAGQWQDAAGRLQLRLPALEAPDFRIGSNWETYGVLRPGNHSYVGLFRAQGVLRPDPGALQSIAGNPAGWMLSSIFGVREKLAAGIDRACGGDARISGTLQALLLGRRNEMDRETLQMFVRTGLVHIFAVSGLHLGLLCGILLFFGRWMGISPRWIPLWVLPLLILFTLYTGLRASALRALVMIAVLLCSMPLYRRAKIENAFALAVILILGTAPAQIYDLGFQYSFLLVGSLLAFGTFFSDQVRAWFAPDPWAPLDPFRQFRHQVLWPRVQGALVVSLLCFMVSAPLTARVFHLFSPVGVLGNLLAVPLVFLLLATGFPALLFVGFPAEFSAALFLPARWSAALLLQWVDFLETLPGGTQWVKAPPLWMLFAFYAGLFALWRWPEKRKWAVGFLLGLGVYAAAGAWM